MPKCWDRADDWAEWVRLNPLASPGGRGQKLLEHFCVDCTPEYAAEMTRQNRCAYPDPVTRPEKATVHA